MDKLQICKQTRKIAADALVVVLKNVLNDKNPISEAKFRDLWLVEMRNSSEIFPDGWYDPPPHGIIVLFGDDKNAGRTKFASVRPEQFWPSEDIFLNRENGILSLYASPVDKKTGLIGDLALTLYLGQDNLIQEFLKFFYSLIYIVFDHAQVGMPFSELASFAADLYKKHGFISDIISITKPTSSNILGHTTPFLENPETNWEDLRTQISKSRVFIDSTQTATIKPPVTFSIEPRGVPKDYPQFPQIMYHTVALFGGKEKELLENFDQLFKIAGMTYMFSD